MMRASMPHILVTNDDGIYSEGIRKLAEVCKAHGRVTIVAPDREQSAASHALTLNRPLRLLQIEENEWIVDGTPSDCVNLAVLKLFKDQRPDLIVSGINFGPNLGDDVTYSGTISAAFEGALLNIRRSRSPRSSASTSRSTLRGVRRRAGARALAEHRDPRIILNVNFPVREDAENFRGVKITILGRRIYGEGVIERKDPRGRSYYWIGGEPPVWHPGEGTDFEAVQSGYIRSRRCTST
jgi:5'-nucleotidase